MDMFNKLKLYAKRNPARAYSYVIAFGAYLAKTIPNFPQDLFNLFLMGSLGIGESVQRIEDNKTHLATIIHSFEILKYRSV